LLGNLFQGGDVGFEGGTSLGGEGDPGVGATAVGDFLYCHVPDGLEAGDVLGDDGIGQAQGVADRGEVDGFGGGEDPADPKPHGGVDLLIEFRRHHRLPLCTPEFSMPKTLPSPVMRGSGPNFSRPSP